MKHLLGLIALGCPLVLNSCGVAQGVIEPTKGLLQSGMRTLTDVEPPASPPTAEEPAPLRIALATSHRGATSAANN